MELYKENLIHKIEDDLAGRNKNWEALENHIKNISDEYDPAKTYQIGDYAIYENTLYRCISETNGEWDSSAWVATSVAAEIVAHKAEDAQKHITESGENANGRYVRFDDGTQICWRTTSITGDSWSNSAWGGKYKNGVVNLPVSFLSGAIPIYSNQDEQVGARGSWSTFTTMSGTSAVSIWLGAFGSSDIVAKGNLMVIGRWK